MPSPRRSCVQTVFVSHVQVTCLTLGVLGKWVIISGVQGNKLMRSTVLLTLSSRKLFSYSTSRYAVMKADFVTFFLLKCQENVGVVVSAQLATKQRAAARSFPTPSSEGWKEKR